MTRAREMIRTAQEEILASIDDLALIDLISSPKKPTIEVLAFASSCQARLR